MYRLRVPQEAYKNMHVMAVDLAAKRIFSLDGVAEFVDCQVYRTHDVRVPHKVGWTCPTCPLLAEKVRIPDDYQKS